MDALVAVYAAALAGLALFGLHRLALLVRWVRVRGREPEGGLHAITPDVTVQVPIYNERYVATRAVLAIARLDYPRNRLQIQILDDSTDDTRQRLQRLTRRLRRLGLSVEHRHRIHRDGFKAGALAAGLATATGEFVAVFDADFVPPPHFLRVALKPFVDPGVGMVQARWGHLNREASLLTRLQAVFLDGHFLIEHVARSRSGCWFNFNGTAGIWRRAAIDRAGGWSADTLTEDLDLSYRAQLAGWRFVYLPGLVSESELPTSMNAFKSQQHRWAKGSVQTARKLLPSIARARQPWRVRLEASLHLTANLTWLLMTIPAVLYVPTLSSRLDPERRGMLVLGAAMTLTTVWVVAWYLVSQRCAGRRLRQTLPELPALLALGIGMSVNNGRAVLEALLGRASGFERTPKTGSSGDRTSFYHIQAPWTLWVELAMVLYFAAGIGLAVVNGRWIALPFLALFMLGFAFVAMGSLETRPAWSGRATLTREPARRVHLPRPGATDARCPSQAAVAGRPPTPGFPLPGAPTQAREPARFDLLRK